ncbi:hypothetical protein Psch_03170 [Pelotomaculum schinkii]|uniref:Uncharacterized protein n=1 Tax=Pelotomaculum schinkii TaxID=78350 RepID=A0A4Y7RAV7_9FIRM|nr:hypothetical protein Psch_03170 [Pelotomaculum schinkii]
MPVVATCLEGGTGIKEDCSGDCRKSIPLAKVSERAAKVKVLLCLTILEKTVLTALVTTFDPAVLLGLKLQSQPSGRIEVLKDKLAQFLSLPMNLRG